jgi:hypothetical protein
MAYLAVSFNKIAIFGAEHAEVITVQQHTQQHRNNFA